VDATMNVHPGWSNGQLYEEFGTHKLTDPNARRRAEDTLRSQRNRWKRKRLTIRLDVPDAQDVRRRTKKQITLTKSTIKRTIEGVIDQQLIAKAPLRPDANVCMGRAPTGKMARDDVKRVLTTADADTQGGHFLDQPPPPTGRIWRGERWRLRDASGGGVYELGGVTSLRYEDCWERRKGYWWDEYEMRWRKGVVPPAYRYFYWYLTFWENPAKYNEYHDLDELHRNILVTYEAGKRHLTLLGRGSLKTHLFLRGRAGYLICEKQDKAQAGIFISCVDDKLSETSFNVITENLSENPRILSFYGYLIDHEKKNKAMGRRRKFTATEAYFKYQATGLDPGLKCMPFLEIKITGWHPYAVFLDDIQEKALSDTYKERYENIFTQRIIPAVGRRGKLFITGTIKGWDDENDIYIRLKNTPGYITHEYPSVVDVETGEAAFPPMKDVVLEKQVLPVLDDDTGEPIILEGGAVYEEEQDVIIEIKHREKYKVNFPNVYTLEDLVYIRMEMKNDDKFFSEYQLQASNPRGKYFNKERLRPLIDLNDFEHFHDVGSFKEYVRKFYKRMVLWVDPGGEGGHGMSIVVMCKDRGCYFLIDAVVIRTGLPDTVKAVAQFLEKYNLKYWGVEGNFSQKEFVGKTLKRDLRKYMNSINKGKLYRPPVIRPNTGNKIQRIREGFQSMLGIEGMDYTFYYNPDIIAMDQFEKEVREFGLDVNTTRKAHQFDLLDAIVSTDIHLLKDTHGKQKGPACSGLKWKKNLI
jgi:hypothetical protein